MKAMLRDLLQNKSFSVSTIIGSTIGMTCTMLLLLWMYSLPAPGHSGTIGQTASKRIFTKLIPVGPDMLYSSPAVNFTDAVEPVQTR